jgi:hypothetical protein
LGVVSLTRRVRYGASCVLVTNSTHDTACDTVREVDSYLSKACKCLKKNASILFWEAEMGRITI